MRYLIAVGLAVLALVGCSPASGTHHGSSLPPYTAPPARSQPVQTCAVFGQADNTLVLITGPGADLTCLAATVGTSNPGLWPPYMKLSGPWTASGRTAGGGGPVVACTAVRGRWVWTLYDPARTGDARTECQSLQASGWTVSY